MAGPTPFGDILADLTATRRAWATIRCVEMPATTGYSATLAPGDGLVLDNDTETLAVDNSGDTMITITAEDFLL